MENITTVSSDTLITDITENSETHTFLTKNFLDNFVFYGKPLNQWGYDLQVQVPDNPSPTELRELFSAVANKTQIAGHYLSMASIINNSLVGGTKDKKAEIIKQIVEHYADIDGKRPAASIIENMANSYLDTGSTIIASRIVKEFFKQKLDCLIEVRKSLEQINLSITSELKYMT